MTLLCSPALTGGYTLIVDGSAERSGDGVLVSPVRAVLHRPAAGSGEPVTEGDACGFDCVELPTE